MKFRYFYIEGGKNPAATFHLHFNEIQIFTDTNCTQNVALNKVATAKNVFNNEIATYGPQKAVDGLKPSDISSIFHSGGNETGDWLQIDLGQEYEVRVIRIYNEYGDGFNAGMQARIANSILAGYTDPNGITNTSLRIWTTTYPNNIPVGTARPSPRYEQFNLPLSDPSVLINPTLSNFNNITKTNGNAPFNLTVPTSNSSGAFTYTSSNTSVATVQIVASSVAPIFSNNVSNLTVPQATMSLAVSPDGNTIVAAHYYNSSLSYSKYNGTSWSSYATLTNSETFGNYRGCCLTSDGSRGVVTSTGGYCYFFAWNGTAYNSPVRTLDNTQRNYYDVGVTGDGSRIVAVNSEGVVFTATWNGSNYTAFSGTDIKTNANQGIGISSDGSKIAYCNAGGNGVYWASWDSGTYSNPILISGAGSNGRRIKFSNDGNLIFYSIQGNSSGSIQYSMWNGSGYSSFQYVPTSAAPASIDPWGFAVDLNSLYSISWPALTINKTTITNISSMSFVPLPKVTIVGAGSSTITATQAETEVYNSASITAVLNVKPAPTFGAFANIVKRNTDSPFELTAPTSNSNGAFTFTSSNASVATISGSTVTIVGVGITTITATQADAIEYGSASVSCLLSVDIGIGFALKPFNSGTNLIDIAYGNGLFVAVSISAPSANKIFTSPDGINWNARTTPVDYSWRAIAYGNGMFVVVTNNRSATNQVITSPDGINWTAQTSPVNTWNCVTYGNGLFVAAPYYSGTNTVMTSPDGINWTSRSAPGIDANAVTYGNGLYVIVGYSGDNRIMTSPDGITWTTRSGSAAGSLYGVTYGNGLYVAVGNGGVLTTSPDGITWTARTVPNKYWWKVIYAGGLFIAISPDGSASPIKSLDGINWSNVPIPSGYSVYGVSYGNGTYLITSNTGAIFSSITISPPILSNFSDTLFKNLGNAPFLLTDPSSNSTGAFTYTSSNTAVATISGKTVTIVGGGSTTITATQAAAGNYESGTISRVLTVRKGNPVLNSININAVGNVYKLIVNTNSSGSFTYSVSDSTAVTVNSDNTLSFSRPSDVLVIAKQAETSNYYSGEFTSIVSYTGPISYDINATNGIISTVGSYKLYIFQTNGSITINGNVTAQVLIVGGGGGGGYGIVNYDGNGGGGAGAVGYGTLNFASGTYTITVGNGGSGGITSSSTVATSGGNSSIIGGTINELAYGGGFGGSLIAGSGQGGGNGGSGGGGSAGWNNSTFGKTGNPTTTPTGTTSNNTSAGPSGAGTLTYIGTNGGAGLGLGGGGGGGGATSAGATVSSPSTGGGAGGAGYTWSINSATYGGGGGGGASGERPIYNVSNTPKGLGGSGGGGNGGDYLTSASAGTANTGGGGGGAWGGSGNGANGANGGSGIVIIAVRL